MMISSVGGGGGIGVGGGRGAMAEFDIDFDCKTTEEYAKLDDVRVVYDVACGNTPPIPPERHSNAMNPIYRGGLPNHACMEKKRVRRFLTLWCVVSLLFGMNLLSLGLGSFNLADSFKGGRLTGGSDGGGGGRDIGPTSGRSAGI